VPTQSRHSIRAQLAETRPPVRSAEPPSILRKAARKAAALRSAERREAARFRALSRIAGVLSPHYVMTAPEKAWFHDEQFFREFYAFEDHDQTADRKYMLRQLLSLVDLVPGDTAECGVYLGASSWFICNHFRSSGRSHHGFDSFEGLPEPNPVDGSFWHTGDLRTREEHALELLRPFDAHLYAGWFPDRFGEVADRAFAFAHVDVDLYQPTLDSLEFFYPRMSPGGVILLDDHGLTTCPGATRAAEEYMAGRLESIVLLTTGQAMILKVAEPQ
jgi:O-methyltransferase